jgi:DNA-binding transcriptional regulator LsrR (DeoR family)
MGVTGDFAYIFFSAKGDLIELADLGCSRSTINRSLFSAGALKRLASRSDARVILIAGGREKLSTIRQALRHLLCNVLITDHGSADELLSAVDQGDS